MGFKLKNMFSAKGLAGLVLAPFTGGASLALTAKEGMKGQKEAQLEKQQKNAAFEERVGQVQEAAATEGRRKRKLAELEEGKEKVTGFSSLIGKGDSLG